MQREKWIDVVKGFAIYLVILGHTIQYASPIDYNRDGNFVFCIIYSFHMPLFMLVSGYLFFYSLQKYSFLLSIKAKVKGIFIPCIAWGIVTYLLDLCCYETNRPASLLGGIHYIFFSNWFLWTVLYCCLIASMIGKLFRQHWSMYIILGIICVLIPKVWNMGGTKRLLLFFIMGMFFNQYKVFQLLEKKKIAMVVIGGLYILSMIFFDGNEYITGTFGSLVVCMIIRWLCEKFEFKVLEKLGQVSIGIYVFSGLLFFFLVKDYMRVDESYRYLIKAGYIAVLSVLIMLVSYGSCVLMKKSNITSRLFLGREQK